MVRWAYGPTMDDSTSNYSRPSPSPASKVLPRAAGRAAERNENRNSAYAISTTARPWSRDNSRPSNACEMLTAASTDKPTNLDAINPREATAPPTTAIPTAIRYMYPLAFDTVHFFESAIDKQTPPIKKLTMNGATRRNPGPCINAITFSNELSSRPGIVIA